MANGFSQQALQNFRYATSSRYNRLNNLTMESTPPQSTDLEVGPGIRTIHNHSHDDYLHNPPLALSTSKYRIKYFLEAKQGHVKSDTSQYRGEDKNVIDISRKSGQNFLRKVFWIMVMQLFMTFGIIVVLVFHPDINSWVKRTPRLMNASGVIVLLLGILTYLSENFRKNYPLNVLLLELLTLTYGVLLGSLSSYLSVEPVLYAIWVTISVCLGFILFPKHQFGVTIVIIGLYLSIFGILVHQEIIPYDFADDHAFQTFFFGSIGAVFLSFFLIWDFTRLVQGNHWFVVSFSSEDYVPAALGIYVDMIFMFNIVLISMGVVCCGRKGITDKNKESPQGELHI